MAADLNLDLDGYEYYSRELKVESIGNVTVCTEQIPEGQYVTHIHVTRYDGRGRMCETRQVYWAYTTVPELSFKHWSDDETLLMFLKERSAEWPAPVYTPIPVTVNGVFQGFLGGDR